MSCQLLGFEFEPNPPYFDDSVMVYHGPKDSIVLFGINSKLYSNFTIKLGFNKPLDWKGTGFDTQASVFTDRQPDDIEVVTLEGTVGNEIGKILTVNAVVENKKFIRKLRYSIKADNGKIIEEKDLISEKTSGLRDY